MNGFSLDDIRDSFRTDMEEQLAAIEAAANAILTAPRGTRISALESSPDTRVVDAIVRAAHTMYGASCLVSVGSLSESSQLLERAAERKLSCDDEEPLRALAFLATDGVASMHKMLAHELDHEADKANALSWAFRRRVMLYEQMQGEGPPPPPEDFSPLGGFRFDAADPSIPEAKPIDEEVEFAFDAAPPPPAPVEPEPAFNLEAPPEPAPEPAFNLETPPEPAPKPAEPEPAFNLEAEPEPPPAFEFEAPPAPKPEPVFNLDPVAESAPVTPPPVDEPAVPIEASDSFVFEHAPPPPPVAPSTEFSFDTPPPGEISPVPPGSDTPQPQIAATAEFSFETGTPPDGLRPALKDSALSKIPGLADELLEIFVQEARESLVALQGYLQTLQKDPNDTVAARSLERIYHTMKGASATVGLTAISEQATVLEDTIENTLETKPGFTPEQVTEMIRRTNRLLVASGLPELDLAPKAEAPDQSPQLRGIFADEARAIFSQIRAGLPALDSPAVRADIQTLLHRLKGSAALFPHETFSKEAGRLQQLCPSAISTADLRAELEDGLERLSAMVDETPAEAPAVEEKPAAPKPAEAAPAPAADVPSLVRESVRFEQDADLRAAFDAECQELIETIERNLFALEDSPQPKNQLNELYRAYHTLKGSVNTMGLSPIGRYLHKVEDFVSDLLAASILPPMKSLTTFLLRVQDRVRLNLDQVRDGFVETDLEGLAKEIARVRGGEAHATEDSAIKAPSKPSGKSSLPSVERGAESGDFAERKSIRVATARLDSLLNLTGELVVSRARMMRRVSALRAMQSELAASRKRLLSTIETFRENYEFSNVKAGRVRTLNRPEPAPIPKAPRGGTATGVDTSSLHQIFSELELDRYDDINILSRSLTEISNDIDEMQAQISQSLESFSEDNDGFSAIVAGLQSEITGARMVPVDTLFARLRRPVRDAAEREKKDVRVLTSGEEVDLDKTIVDALYLPMLHLVRNAVAHGIESSEARSAAGKDPVGTVLLSARQESGQIVLEITDDGNGLNLRGLLDKGLERGLLPVGTAMTDARVPELIFVSGVSTSESISDVSGRGVGCDVVRRELEKLNGHISVYSQAGKGTTFKIILPLTLAIRRALLIRQHGQVFAIPLNFSLKTVDLASASIADSAGVRRIEIDGVYLSLVKLADVLQLPDRPTDNDKVGTAIVLAVGDHRFALQVDRVISQDEVVVKGLGDLVANHPLFSGVTISGDGELFLIIDVPGLLEAAGRTDATVGMRSSALETGPAKAAAASDTEPLKVLFIDDSLSVRKVAEKFLKALGVDLTLAVDGLDGLTKLRQGRFDLVFTDLEMPRMHGYDLIRELRYVPAFRDVPVVVVTSRSGEKHRAQAQLVGANDYVTKPFTQEILAQKLSQWAVRKAAR